MDDYDPSAVVDLFPPAAWVDRCSGNGDRCVQVNHGVRGLHAVRDNKLTDSPVLVFDDQEYRAFVLAEARALLDSEQTGR